jgi:hypothetical protein
LAKSWQDILDAVTSLWNDQHDFKTVVIDSIDWAERLAHEKVCADHNVKGIESIGYGRGWSFSADLWSELLGGLTALRDHKSMNVILIAHSEIKTFQDPQGPAYDRWQTKAHKLVGKMLSEYADCICFAQIETIVKTEKPQGFKEEGRSRALTTGRHVLMTAPSPAFEAGSRFFMPASVPLEWAEFQKALDAARK